MAKALNSKNLSVLGPERLADLLIEVIKGRADLQRRLRLELSAEQGPDDVARDLRKRYAALRQAKGYISRKTHRSLAKEIASFITMIETSIAPVDPALGFDLLWELLHLATGLLARTNGTGGVLAEAFNAVMPAVGRVAPTLSLPAGRLADMARHLGIARRSMSGHAQFSARTSAELDHRNTQIRPDPYRKLLQHVLCILSQNALPDDGHAPSVCE